MKTPVSPSGDFTMTTASHLGLLLALTAAVSAPAAAQTTSETATTPPGAPSTRPSAAPAPTPELIAQGDKIFHGPGNCYACHGSKAEGLVGPNLTDAEWIHSKGSLQDIVAQV